MGFSGRLGTSAARNSSRDSASSSLASPRRTSRCEQARVVPTELLRRRAGRSCRRRVARTAPHLPPVELPAQFRRRTGQRLVAIGATVTANDGRCVRNVLSPGHRSSSCDHHSIKPRERPRVSRAEFRPPVWPAIIGRAAGLTQSGPISILPTGLLCTALVCWLNPAGIVGVLRAGDKSAVMNFGNRPPVAMWPGARAHRQCANSRHDSFARARTIIATPATNRASALIGHSRKCY